MPTHVNLEYQIHAPGAEATPGILEPFYALHVPCWILDADTIMTKHAQQSPSLLSCPGQGRSTDRTSQGRCISWECHPFGCWRREGHGRGRGPPFGGAARRPSPAQEEVGQPRVPRRPRVHRQACGQARHGGSAGQSIAGWCHACGTGVAAVDEGALSGGDDRLVCVLKDWTRRLCDGRQPCVGKRCGVTACFVGARNPRGCIVIVRPRSSSRIRLVTEI